MSFFEHYLVLSVGTYCVSVLCFLLAILVIHSNPQSRSCKFAFLFNFSVGIWAFLYATTLLSKDDAIGMFMGQMHTASQVWLSVFVTHFVLVQVKLDGKKKIFICVNYFLSAILSIVIFIPKLVVAGIPAKLTLPAYIDGGPLFSLIPIQLFFNFFYSAHHLIKGIKRSRGFKKNQLSLFLAALLAGYLAGTPGYLLVYDIPHVPITTPLVALYPLIFSYAIVKHRFLDIQRLVKNTLIFSCLFIFLLSCASFALLFLKEFGSRWMGMSEALAQAIAIALAIGLYGPMKQALSKFTHRFLFQHAENPETVFRNLSEDLLRCLEPATLAATTVQRLTEILALDRAGFYLRSAHASVFDLIAASGRMRKKQLYGSKQMVQYLERTKEVLLGPKQARQQASMELAALGGIAAIPIFVKENLRAILILGRKKSDAPWRDEEFQVLKSFARHLSLALANAEYAESIRRSRECIIRSERDASAGALISGVDHEVKSPLHAMSLSLSLLKERMANSNLSTERALPAVRKTMEGLLEDARSVNRIIQHLSDLAHRKPLSIEGGVRPAEAARKVIEKLYALEIKKGIHIICNIPLDFTMDCDASALAEIFENLIRNAVQAISGQGEIVIEAERKNEETILRVRDTGEGIPQEFMNRIFEPFFTTKKDGGSGMGLFIVRESMQSMGGRIEVESTLGKGSVFSLHFAYLSPALQETS